MRRPDEWKEASLGELTLRPAIWDRNSDPRDRIRYVDVSAVDRDRMQIVSDVSHTAGDAPSRARKIVKTGDTIFATVRPTLRRIAQVPISLNGEIVSTAFCVLRPDPNQIDADFLFYAAQARSVIDGVAALETGASYPAVRDSDVRAQVIPVPPLTEQRTIAGILSALRTGCIKEWDCEVAAGALKSAATRDLFTRGLRSGAQKETEFGLMPLGWRVGRLFDFARFQRGFDITKSEQADGAVPVVSSGGTRSYHNVAAAKGPGVVIGRKGSIGSLHYLEEDYWPHDTTLWCTDFLGNLPKFVFYRLHLVDMKRLDSGAANPALNRNALHDEMIAWPDEEEQKGIVNILEAIDLKIDLHRRKLAVLEQLFRALLHRLMTGEIRVADLNFGALT